MKISKIYNNRFARNNYSGYLYKGNIDNKTDIKFHTEKRISEAQNSFKNLFTLFNTNFLSDSAREFNNLIKELILSNGRSIIDINEINKCFVKITEKDFNNLKNQYKQLLCWKKNFSRPEEISPEILESIIKSIECKYYKDSSYIVKSIANNVIGINDKTISWLNYRFFNNNNSTQSDAFSLLYDEIDKIVNSNTTDEKSCLFVLKNKMEWSSNLWYECYKFVTNVGYKYLKSKCINEIEEYEISLIFRCMKNAMIDLKPVNIYSRYKKETKRVDKIKIKLIAKTMGYIKNYVCNAIIRVGKQQFLSEKYLNDTEEILLSSFHYELQKAEDEINVRNNSAISFSTVWVNKIIEGNMDFKDLHDLDSQAKSDDKNTKFDDNFFKKTFKIKYKVDNDLFKGIVKLLYSIRNSVFHFNVGKYDDKEQKNEGDDKSNKLKLIEVLNEELNTYPNLIKQKIYSNCCNLYYDVKDLLKLFSNNDVLYENVAYMPGFSNILKLLQRDEKILSILDKRKNAMIFLLKTIYQKHYLKECIEQNKQFHQTAVNKFDSRKISEKDKRAKQAFIDIKSKIVDKSIRNISRKLLEKLSFENNTDKSQTKDKFLKIMLDQLVKDDFLFYVEERFKFVLNQSLEELNQTIDFDIATPKDDSLYLNYYFLGRIIPNRIANELANSYGQYYNFIDDAANRHNIDGKLKTYIDSQKEIINKIKKSLNLAIEFSDFEFTYDDKSKNVNLDHLKETIEILFSDDIDKKSNNYKQIYFNNDSLVNFKGINEAYKYGFDKVLNGIPNKISQDDINTYINNRTNKEAFIKIYDKIRDYKDLRPNTYINEKEWIDLNKYIANKNLIELNEAYQFFSIYVDLQKILLSYTFKRERDIFYFIIGEKYLLLKGKMEKNDFDEIYSIFIHGEGNGKTVSAKIKKYFEKNKKVLYDKYFCDTKGLRNSIDHFDIFKNVKNTCTILNILEEVYSNLLIYDRKLQKNLFPKVQKVFENFGIDIVKNKVLSFEHNNDKLEISINYVKMIKNEQKEMELRIPKQLKLAIVNNKIRILNAYDRSDKYAKNILELMRK